VCVCVCRWLAVIDLMLPHNGILEIFGDSFVPFLFFKLTTPSETQTL